MPAKCITDLNNNKPRTTNHKPVYIYPMKKALFSFVFCSLAQCIFAQHVRYDFSAPNAVHHEAEITVTADGLPAGPAIFRMSRSSPGRYATHEFGKNVYNVKAVDASGKPLNVVKTDAEVYQVSEHKGTVKLTYTLYGSYADGTYMAIDPTEYHINMPATFMWVKGLDNAPITIHFDKPADWQVATQLKPTNDPLTFTAPGLQYFMDAPVKVGKIHFRQWQVKNGDNQQYTFRLALDADANEVLIDSFTTKLQKLAKEEQAVFGEVPKYDFGSYTFLASFGSFFHGDGMEHRNSTMITSSAPFTGADNQLSVFAHEFFHNWNVERIRPKSLEPFNFEKSNMSELLWVAEGFTQYYGLLLMKRAGFTSDEDFMQQMSSLINAKEHTPGGEYYTPIENSQRAVFADAGVSIDRTNYPNMFTTYYYYGGALALALDLQLRTQFNKSLDVFMQEMWKRFGKNEKAYTLPEMQAALASVSNASFADNFFKKYVYDSQSINYAQLLQAAGCTLQKMAEGKAWIGNTRINLNSDKQLVVVSPTVRNTPVYDAGVDIDDVLLQLDGKDLKQLQDIDNILSAHKPGDVVKIVYLHRNERVERDMTIKESPFVKIVPSKKGNNLSTSQMNFLSSWTSSHIKA